MPGAAEAILHPTLFDCLTGISILDRNPERPVVEASPLPQNALSAHKRLLIVHCL